MYEVSQETAAQKNAVVLWPLAPDDLSPRQHVVVAIGQTGARDECYRLQQFCHLITPPPSLPRGMTVEVCRKVELNVEKPSRFYLSVA